jgi:flagellar hook-associated protein 1
MFEMRDVFIADLRNGLNTLAVDLTSAVNDVHTTGWFIDPATGDPATGQFFSMT